MQCNQTVKDVCHPNAECIRNICVCKSGFHGDGVKTCSKKCICEVVGDPHIHGFDGHFMTFPGRCRYTMSRTTTAHDSCGFNIEIKNDNTGPSGDQDMQSSWLRTVYIQTQDHIIKFKRMRIIEVDGYLRYMPVHVRSPKGFLAIVHNGPWVILATSCGLHVKWDGDSTVKIEAPTRYIGNLTGLCGNCNGLPDDDYKTKTGSDESKLSPLVRDMTVGDSYLVRDKNGKQTLQECSTILVNNRCPQKIELLAYENCGFLNYLHPRNPFRGCIDKNPRLAETLLHACAKDACHYWMLGQLFMKKLVCGYMSSFAETCARNGFKIVWRHESFCPLFCPSTMPYKPIATPCQSTCMAPKPVVCHLSYNEGCQCREGYLLSGNTCVAPKLCGCHTNAGYIPVGSTFTSLNCSEIQECQVISGKPLMITKQRIHCHKYAKCVNLEGKTQCHCSSGFTGDGIDQCIPKTHPEPTLTIDESINKLMSYKRPPIVKNPIQTITSRHYQENIITHAKPNQSIVKTISHTHHLRSHVKSLPPAHHTEHVTTHLNPLSSTSTTKNHKYRISTNKPTNYKKNTKQLTHFKSLTAAKIRSNRKLVTSHKLLRKFNRTESEHLKTYVKPLSPNLNKRSKKKHSKIRDRSPSPIVTAKSRTDHFTSHGNSLLSPVNIGHMKETKRWSNNIAKENSKYPSDHVKSQKTNRNHIVPSKNKYKLISGRASKLKPFTTPELTDNYYSGSSTEEVW
ncbi:zonadhesin-like [Mytilus californianus]|uniref:zonadhesin-like n=1 Tax=Mytilus californianus TaxID=6549 RepID=UPI002247F377|nr:zonadhesin-like [Mytilus californianus]